MVVVVDGRGRPVFSQAGRIQADAVLSEVEALASSGQ